MQVYHESPGASAAAEASEVYHLDENLTIAGEVIAALAEDPRTASSVIEAVYERGVLTLTGEVENEPAHTAAEEIAHRHPQVMSVVNALEVLPKADTITLLTKEFGRLLVEAYGTTVGTKQTPVDL
jgi:hypothetical protein